MVQDDLPLDNPSDCRQAEPRVPCGPKRGCTTVILRALISLVLLTTSVPTVAFAQNDGKTLDPVARRVSRLANELHSPFCPGKTLLTCTSYQAIEVRREISALAEKGQSDAQIIETLQKKYGDHFEKGRQIANPVQPWYTIIVPFLPFVLLAFLLIWVFRRWRRPASESDADEPPSTPESTAEDEARLARLRGLIQNDTE